MGGYCLNFGAKSDNLNYVYLNCARCQGLSETEDCSLYYFNEYLDKEEGEEEEKTQILQDMM